MACFKNINEHCPSQFCKDCEFYKPLMHQGNIVYTTTEENFKCNKCVYYDKNRYQLNDYGDKLPDTCLTGSDYYCVVSGYSLFELKDKS